MKLSNPTAWDSHMDSIAQLQAVSEVELSDVTLEWVEEEFIPKVKRGCDADALHKVVPPELCDKLIEGARAILADEPTCIEVSRSQLPLSSSPTDLQKHTSAMERLTALPDCDCRKMI